MVYVSSLLPPLFSIPYLVLLNMGLLIILKNMLQHNYKLFLTLFLGFQLAVTGVPYLMALLQNTRIAEITSPRSELLNAKDTVRFTYEKLRIAADKARKRESLESDLDSSLRSKVIRQRPSVGFLRKDRTGNRNFINERGKNTSRSSVIFSKSSDNGSNYNKKIIAEGIHAGSRQKSNYYKGNLSTSDPLTLAVPLPFLSYHKNPCFYDFHGNVQCLPYFMLLTPQKCGSSDLWETLSRHPHIVKATRKEIHWFNRRRFGVYPNYSQQQQLTHYMQFFTNVNKQYVKSVGMGENNMDNTEEMAEAYNPFVTFDSSASTLYDQLLWRKIPQNQGKDEPSVISAHFIRHLIPNAKFVVMLREPVSRLYSDWLYFMGKFNSSQSAEAFHQAVRSGISEWEKCVSDRNRTFRQCLYDLPSGVNNLNYWHPDLDWCSLVRLRIGMYYYFLKDWLSIFPRNQFFITSLKQYSFNRAQVAKEIFKFLGLDSVRDLNVDWIPRNTRDADLPVMLARTRKLLEKFYRPFNVELKQLLNDDTFLWNRQN